MEDLGPIGSDWPTRQKMKHDQPLTWFWRAASAHSCQCSMMLNALMTFQCLKFTRTWRSWNRKLPKSLRATQARDWCSLVFLQNVIQRLFSTFMAQKTARRPKTPQQARRGCKVFFAYCNLLSDLPFGLGFQALKMEVCKSRPQAFGSAAGSFCT
jgi:hypothetical protein